MKTVILAGGFGSRISEETKYKPKPLIEIGGKPILWHIMKGYSYYGFNEFIICAGYKQHLIKSWFADYYLRNCDITFDFTNGREDTIIHDQHCEPWKVTVVDTGLNTMTGGRIKRIHETSALPVYRRYHSWYTPWKRKADKFCYMLLCIYLPDKD